MGAQLASGRCARYRNGRAWRTKPRPAGGTPPQGCRAGWLSTYRGSVTAAGDWDEPARRRRVRPGLAGSYEALLHEIGMSRFQLDLNDPSRWHHEEPPETWPSGL
ncbi:erythromycin esterase family protein [Lysobacter tyrosinilyticus]